MTSRTLITAFCAAKTAQSRRLDRLGLPEVAYDPCVKVVTRFWQVPSA